MPEVGLPLPNGPKTWTTPVTKREGCQVAGVRRETYLGLPDKHQMSRWHERVTLVDDSAPDSSDLTGHAAQAPSRGPRA